MFTDRQNKLTNHLLQQGMDGLVLNAGPSLTYFTGLHFHLMERPVVFILTPEKLPLIILPELEKAKLDHCQFNVDSFTYPDNPDQWPGIFAKACTHLNIDHKRFGAEPGQLRLLEYTLLTQAAESLTLEDADRAISMCRAIKDDAEIAKMERAVAIAQESLTATMPIIKEGAGEQEIAAELVIQLFRHGSDPELPFSPIVSSGPNGANPHAKPSQRRLASGDLLIIDWGATWQGYTSDLTRTFGIGSVSGEAKHIHALVNSANRAGCKAAVPGVACSEVDRAARSVITKGGYGPQFRHRTGHGLGMECHEEPYIHDANSQLLVPGMTFTVEPGIYLQGINGVRIEDDILITMDGSRSLSNFPRDLICI